MNKPSACALRDMSQTSRQRIRTRCSAPWPRHRMQQPSMF